MLRLVGCVAALLLACSCRGDAVADAPEPLTPHEDVATAPDASPEGTPPGRAPRLAIPEATPLATLPLGEAAWRTLAVSPARDALAVATADEVMLLALPEKIVKWRRATAQPTAFLAFSRDGRELAALGRSDDGQLPLMILASSDGAPTSERVFEGLRSPPHPEHGRQPPPWPTAMMPAKGEGYWITNAFGVYLAAPGQTKLSEVKAFSDNTRFVAAQDGGSYWRSANLTLERLDRPGTPAVAIECYAQTFVIDPGLDRAVTSCWDSGKPPELLVVELSSGKTLARIDSGADLPSVAIVDKDTLALVSPYPSKVGWVRLAAGGAQVEWRAQANGFGAIEFSPSGARAAGVGGGAFQVVEVASGKVLCDHAVLGPDDKGSVLAAGFADEQNLWLLGYEPAGGNALTVAPLVLEAGRPGCKLGARKSLGIGKTTNLVPLWVAKAPGFVLDALVGQGYGLTLVGVDGKVRMLADKATPAFVVSDDGARVGAVDHQGANVWSAAGETAASFGELAKLLVCGDRILTYRWNEGWTVRDASGQKELARFDTPQPDTLACRGSTLFVADRRSLLVIDVAREPVVKKAFAIEGPLGTMAVSPDGGTLLLPGGGSGWRKVSLAAGPTPVPPPPPTPDTAPAVVAAQKKLRDELGKDFPKEQIEVRQEQGPFDLLIAVAAYPGAYPGSGVYRVAVDPKSGVSYGRWGERSFADFARERGWLKALPELETLIRFTNTLLFDGVAMFDDKPMKPEAKLKDGRLVIRVIRRFMPSHGGETLTVTVGAAGPETVERQPLKD